MAFRYRDDIALADIAIEAEAATPGELFAEVWNAALGLLLDEPASLRSTVRRCLSLAGEELDLLLFDFLGRLITLKDTERLLLRAVRVRLEPQGELWSLAAELEGEPVDPSRHQLGIDLKAVTLYRLEVGRTRDGWRALVVLDV